MEGGNWRALGGRPYGCIGLFTTHDGTNRLLCKYIMKCETDQGCPISAIGHQEPEGALAFESWARVKQ